MFVDQHTGRSKFTCTLRKSRWQKHVAIASEHVIVPLWLRDDICRGLASRRASFRILAQCTVAFNPACLEGCLEVIRCRCSWLEAIFTVTTQTQLLFFAIGICAMTFTGFALGQIKAHMHHGLGPLAISRILLKPNGKSHWTLILVSKICFVPHDQHASSGEEGRDGAPIIQHRATPASPFFQQTSAYDEQAWSDTAIKNAIDRMAEEPKWRGERREGSGAHRKTTPEQDQNIQDWVIANRGTTKVTVARIRKQFPYLRRLSKTLVEERLNEAELGWQRRRNKSKVGSTYLAERVDYCHAVKRKWQDTLERWAYVDGTVYYLDRTAAEHEQSLHAALGKFVWRRLDGKDALWQDCIAPSMQFEFGACWH